MSSNNQSNLCASVIISVYKDIEALHSILLSLDNQSRQDFEIIVTEDGEDPAMAAFLAGQKDTSQPLTHLTQPDEGFRKTRAVNRAVAAAKSPYVIFIDGDCIVHPDFVAMHVENAEPGKVLTGRKVNLGPKVSKLVRRTPWLIKLLINKLSLFLLAIPLHLDHIRNFETGIGGRLMHHFARDRYLGIMGCNFSCYREDMLKINGYNEDLPGIGGEDDDLEWRFNGLDMFTKSIKFLAPVYHLYHDSRRMDYNINIAIMNENKANKQFVSEKGIKQHLAADQGSHSG